LDVLTFFVLVLIIWIIAFIAIARKREELQKKGIILYPFFLMMRRDARSEWFPKLSKTKAYRALDWAFVGLAYASMGLGFWLLLSIVIAKLTSKVAPAALTPIIPGVTVPLAQAIYILLAIAIAVTLHELMHAISSTSNGIRVKGGGFLLIFIFPGAFVEPDEEEFKSASVTKRIKVVSAGIAINLILAVISFFLLGYLAPALSQGALIVGVIKDYPAYNASIAPGQVIVAINGHPVHVPSQVDELLSTTSPNVVTLLVNGSLINKTVITPQGKLGVYLAYYYPSSLVSGLMDFLLWFYTINFSLATINALPLFITDGTKLISELFNDESLGRKVSMGLSVVTIGLFLMAIQI